MSNSKLVIIPEENCEGFPTKPADKHFEPLIYRDTNGFSASCKICGESLPTFFNSDYSIEIKPCVKCKMGDICE